MTAAAKSWRHVVTAFLPAGLWALTLFVLSSLPANDLPRTSLLHADKLVHAAVYGVLGALCARGFRRGHGRSMFAAATLGALTATCYGATDELHQLLVPGRSADSLDLLADAIGACLGAFLDGAAHRRRQRRQRDLVGR